MTSNEVKLKVLPRPNQVLFSSPLSTPPPTEYRKDLHGLTASLINTSKYCVGNILTRNENKLNISSKKKVWRLRMAYTSGELSRQVAEGPSVIKPWSLAVARAPSKDVPATTTTTGILENEQVPSSTKKEN